MGEGNSFAGKTSGAGPVGTDILPTLPLLTNQPAPQPSVLCRVLVDLLSVLILNQYLSTPRQSFRAFLCVTEDPWATGTIPARKPRGLGIIYHESAVIVNTQGFFFLSFQKFFSSFLFVVRKVSKC